MKPSKLLGIAVLLGLPYVANAAENFNLKLSVDKSNPDLYTLTYTTVKEMGDTCPIDADDVSVIPAKPEFTGEIKFTADLDTRFESCFAALSHRSGRIELRLSALPEGTYRVIINNQLEGFIHADSSKLTRFPTPLLVKSIYAGSFAIPSHGIFCVIYEDKVVLQEKTEGDVKEYSNDFIQPSGLSSLIEKAKQGEVSEIGILPASIPQTMYGLADQATSSPQRVQMGMTLKHIAGNQTVQNNSEATESLLTLIDSECSKVK